MASYGTEAGVAMLCRRFADPTTALFTTATVPTLAAVTSWLSQISSMVNIALATAGFATPITDADATPAIDGFVNSMAADLAMAANTTGRFYVDRIQESGANQDEIIAKSINAWVSANIAGLEAMGATRATSDTDQIAFRDVDSAGNTVDALFQRDNFMPWRLNR
jgi:hypothetical protein